MFTRGGCPLPSHPQDSPDEKTYYWKVHGKWDALLEGAERIGLRMPISVSWVSGATSRCSQCEPGS